MSYVYLIMLSLHMQLALTRMLCLLSIKMSMQAMAPATINEAHTSRLALQQHCQASHALNLAEWICAHSLLLCRI
jgi:hypothetical protein